MLRGEGFVIREAGRLLLHPGFEARSLYANRQKAASEKAKKAAADAEADGAGEKAVKAKAASTAKGKGAAATEPSKGKKAASAKVTETILEPIPAVASGGGGKKVRQLSLLGADSCCRKQVRSRDQTMVRQGHASAQCPGQRLPASGI